MKRYVPRVAAVHDISCFGRCSLTVIIPVLSAMGIQVCPLPTAVLSTHFGGFSPGAICDFTTQMPNFYNHWKTEGVSFDCIYSGFLASDKQIDVVSNFINEFSQTRPLVVVDPVMGDDGKLYSPYTSDMQQRMKELVRQADIITPNYTEACFLLGETYQSEVSDVDKLRKWLLGLADFGPAMVVVTGIPFANDKIMNIAYNRNNNAYCQTVSERIPARYPGTGDIFASVLIGELMGKKEMPDAVKRAADFVSLCIKATVEAGTPTREGVLLEGALPWLLRKGVET